MSNWDLIEKNELSQNAQGGTELFMKFIYGGGIPRELLEQVQIIPSRVRELKMDKIRILTFHDLPDEPDYKKLMDESYRNKFHKLVFISNWQYQQFRNYLGIQYNLQSTVIEHGLEPSNINIMEKQKKDVIDIAYFTTPHRGLNILVQVFDILSKEDKNIHLHVHSSFKAYGWEDRDKEYQPLFDYVNNHPQMTYYGFTPYEELREKIKSYDIFAYPCIWQETACRSLLEAMSTGMLCVHPNFGALPDTSGGLNIMYDGSTDINEHGGQFALSLKHAINSIRTGGEALRNRMIFNKVYADTRYDPKLALGKWNHLITDLMKKYPDEGSRSKIPSPVAFNYRTT